MHHQHISQDEALLTIYQTAFRQQAWCLQDMFEETTHAGIHGATLLAQYSATTLGYPASATTRQEGWPMLCRTIGT